MKVKLKFPGLPFPLTLINNDRHFICSFQPFEILLGLHVFLKINKSLNKLKMFSSLGPGNFWI